MIRTRIHVSMALLVALVVGSACSSSHRADDEADDMGFHVTVSNTEIVEGEIVTVTAMTSNTLGRHAEVEWTTTAGNLDAEQEGRIARVQFDDPGTYTITGRLMVDGRLVDRDSVDIHVRSVN